MYETLTRNSAAICHTGQRGSPLALWRDREEAYRVPAAPLTSSLQDARARLPAGIVRRQLAVRARLDQHGWVEQAIAWQAHIGGVLAGLPAFAALDPIPISTGGGPHEGMDTPPPRDQSLYDRPPRSAPQATALQAPPPPPCRS